MINRHIKTERLLLRPWREEDAENLYEYAKDPLVGPPAGWPPHSSVEESHRIIQEILSHPETYAVCLREDGRAIGSISLKFGENTDLTERTDACELGYWIARPFWGRGLIPEAAEALLRHAFLELGMNAVLCGYYEGNEKSHRVQEKLGFIYHHTAEHLHLPLLNEYRTGHVSILTRERWLSRHPS